jgi:hypothetical protein
MRRAAPDRRKPKKLAFDTIDASFFHDSEKQKWPIFHANDFIAGPSRNSKIQSFNSSLHCYVEKFMTPDEFIENSAEQTGAEQAVTPRATDPKKYIAPSELIKGNIKIVK